MGDVEIETLARELWQLAINVVRRPAYNDIRLVANARANGASPKEARAIADQDYKDRVRVKDIRSWDDALREATDIVLQRREYFAERAKEQAARDAYRESLTPDQIADLSASIIAGVAAFRNE